jgi:hypothetical protein
MAYNVITCLDRQLAIKEGRTWYMPDKPCSRGHLAKKWMSGTCTKCESEIYIQRRKAREYGFINVEALQSQLKLQGNRCAICKKRFTKNIKPNIDHDHKTLSTRGMLCRPCNQGLGFYDDDPKLLRQAANYLERFK